MWHDDRFLNIEERAEIIAMTHTQLNRLSLSLSLSLSVSQIRVRPSFVVFHCSGESRTNTQHTPASMLCYHQRYHDVTFYVTQNIKRWLKTRMSPVQLCLPYLYFEDKYHSQVPGSPMWHLSPLSHWDTRADRSSSFKQMQAPPNSTRQISQSI